MRTQGVMTTASRSLIVIAISLLAPIIRVGWWLGLEDTDFGEYARTRGRWGCCDRGGTTSP